MKHFLNDRSTLVAEAVEGEILASGGSLTRLDGFPDIRVVVRADWDRSRVAIVSGGGAGHEPAHVGFVGRGMLTAAVCGDVFASPSTDAVLAAILAVTGKAGVLLIVKNYTGDRLNFGLAAERARAMGHSVGMVIVGDDVALPELAQPRGVAGTLFVHKIAGHAAETGADLDTVTAAASAAAAATASIGMALTTCTVPGREAESRMGHDEAELGLGIHGEPGVERIRLVKAGTMVGAALARLDSYLTSTAAPLALLINNLGGLPSIEMALVTKHVLKSPLGHRVELVFGPAPLMTSLDMKGFSVSVLALDAARREALLAPVTPKAWPPGVRTGVAALLPVPKDRTVEPARDRDVRSSDSQAARAWLLAPLNALIGLEDELNRLDAKVGDGDTGTTIARAARSILADVDNLVMPRWGDTLSGLAQKTGQTMGGSSGVLISIFLSAAGAALAQDLPLPAALRTGLDRVTYYGGAHEGDRTMIDALGPAIAAMEAGDGLAAIASAAQAGAERTANIGRTRAGRSSYLKETDLLGTPDPGAVAVAALFKALADRVGALPDRP